jgi:hypothetical protein
MGMAALDDYFDDLVGAINTGEFATVDDPVERSAFVAPARCARARSSGRDASWVSSPWRWPAGP